MAVSVRRLIQHRFSTNLDPFFKDFQLLLGLHSLHLHDSAPICRKTCTCSKYCACAMFLMIFIFALFFFFVFFGAVPCNMAQKIGLGLWSDFHSVLAPQKRPKIIPKSVKNQPKIDGKRDAKSKCLPEAFFGQTLVDFGLPAGFIFGNFSGKKEGRRSRSLHPGPCPTNFSRRGTAHPPQVPPTPSQGPCFFCVF